ncbi:pentatricopeptide repeat-containing protein At3g29230 [Cryptomeria japonica]|uniref:pentatricopeptide repeat-containing protein At3g29230 n=1 Tax=Cryptomeria japonica TaxID=3369 RepID=UPI0027D9FDEE|nr:pentatricopeptide repeat-containing protein At3g29230 [Cryptomeria japonica]
MPNAEIYLRASCRHRQSVGRESTQPPYSLQHGCELLYISSTMADLRFQGNRVGKLTPASMSKFKFTPQKYLQDNLIRMYARCGSLVDAREVFDQMIERDVFSWNIIIAAYRRYGFPQEALALFHQLRRTGIQADQFTFASILPTCAKLSAFKEGVEIHQSIIEGGFPSDVVVTSALVDMYVKCGSINKARQLFDKMPQRDVVSWTAMVAGYAQNGELEEALRLFKEMPQRNAVSWNVIIAGYAQSGFVEKALDTFKQMQLAGINPVSSTFVSILPVCAKMGALEQGYVNNGALNEALRLFTEMPERNVISWTAMVGGYAQNGFDEKALETFKQMQLAGIKPDSTTFASILPACAKMGVVEQGINIHRSIIELGLLSDVVLVNALMDLYAKCGSIHKARALFDRMPRRDVIAWNALIAGYAQNGLCEDAFKLFELMRHSGTCPDHVSYTCILLACSHAGLVDEGCKYFNSMSEFHFIMLTIDHYVCMVDILARAGYLEETLNFIIKMPLKPVVVVWKCLLGACRPHKNIGLGLFTATLLFELDPENVAAYALLSNIYAEMGMWGEVQILRRLMKDRGIKKVPGCSWIEDQKMIHAFCVGDKSHPETQAIYAGWIEDQKMIHAFCVGDKSHPQTQEIYAELENLSREKKATEYFLNSRHTEWKQITPINSVDLCKVIEQQTS